METADYWQIANELVEGTRIPDARMATGVSGPQTTNVPSFRRPVQRRRNLSLLCFQRLFTQFNVPSKAQYGLEAGLDLWKNELIVDKRRLNVDL